MRYSSSHLDMSVCLLVFFHHCQPLGLKQPPVIINHYPLPAVVTKHQVYSNWTVLPSCRSNQGSLISASEDKEAGLRHGGNFPIRRFLNMVETTNQLNFNSLLLVDLAYHCSTNCIIIHQYWSLLAVPHSPILAIISSYTGSGTVCCCLRKRWCLIITIYALLFV